jgi:flavin-dependent dehydrogenase
MAVMKSITIAGGGLAGLTLGIGLRQRGVPAALWEAGHYPRHRVSGEFICGRGQETLARLGLLELLERAGAVSADTAAFFSATKSTGPLPLPLRAICLSCFTLDATLAEKFRELGGELLEGKRRSDEDYGEGVVRTTGRRLQTEEGGARWFGIKAHARNVPLTAGLEMHVSPRGYVGLCRVNGGMVNVCGLLRCRAGESVGPQNWRELLRGPAGPPLHQRLASAEFDENSFCVVAGLSLQPRRAVANADCCIGDAITMIPPITGNGMSMAIESAELAIEPLVAWSRGEISWAETQSKIASRCDAAFARRLFWAKWLQRCVLTPLLQNMLIMFTARSDWFWRMAFERTR